MRRNHFIQCAFIFISLVFAGPSAAASNDVVPSTRVMVLGVNHAVQLISEHDQPGMLTNFIDAIKPAAIGVEWAPEPFARGNHYEFTYEVQDIVLPHARASGIAVFPFDWEPPHADQLLGWGLALSEPPEVREPEGFLGFLSFSDPALLKRTFFHAENDAALAPIHSWAGIPSEQASRDLPRRMFLYRTFLQARRIQQAARQWRGKTMLVVVGEFHKTDIERILSDDKAITLVSPDSVEAPSLAAAERAMTREQRIAIASFNLLGMQAKTGHVNWDWIDRVLSALEAENTNAEVRLLRTRYQVLTKTIGEEQAIDRYRIIADDNAAKTLPTWNGVRDRARVDSYFDPFGNLRVDQRARVELARELYRQGRTQEAAAIRSALKAELTSRQARQFDSYWEREIGPVVDSNR